jgi:hypothetical protein
MSRLSLPARSLRGRPASLRTVPDGAGGLLRKRLICHALLAKRPAISGVESIFLPALRELSGSEVRVGAGWRTGSTGLFASRPSGGILRREEPFAEISIWAFH